MTVVTEVDKCCRANIAEFNIRFGDIGAEFVHTSTFDDCNVNMPSVSSYVASRDIDIIMIDAPSYIKAQVN